MAKHALHLKLAIEINQEHYAALRCTQKTLEGAIQMVTLQRRAALRVISQDDAIDEGFGYGNAGPDGTHSFGATPRGAFLRAFFDLNKRVPEGSNPWVWVLEFKRVPLHAARQAK